MSFNELNTVEQMVIDAARSRGWAYVPANGLPRSTADVLVEPKLREALIRLNPEIARRPEYADDVIHKIRAILLSVPAEGVVRANERLSAWLRNEHTEPFGPDSEHVPVRLVDFEDPTNNDLVVTSQLVYKPAGPQRPGLGPDGVRFDVVLLVSGVPVAVGEAKTPVRPSVSWVDGASDLLDDYEPAVPEFFAGNVLNFATEGKKWRFGTLGTPLDKWAPWHTEGQDAEGALADVQATAARALDPAVVLDLLRHFTVFSAAGGKSKKVLARYQQWEAANLIVERVAAGRVRQGLLWHFQGSGKSLLMLFAARKLRVDPRLKNPAVLVVVDRVDLDTQITGTFSVADVPNTVVAGSRKELEQLLRRDTRKVVITTIHKFGEAEGVLNDAPNVIALVDEAHRTQEGDLGRRMREALPNAFLFGLTGTPINRLDKNTFRTFGAEEDASRYLSRYSFTDALRDGTTLPLHFRAAEPNLRIARDALDAGYAELTARLEEEDRDTLSKQAARAAVLLKTPARVDAIAQHVADHFRDHVASQGFKAQLVAYDRECCVLYADRLAGLLGEDAVAVVMHSSQGDPEAWAKHARSPEEEAKLLDRFRDPADPLSVLIVTSKLLTGFDAPILQAMYLDKPMRDHTLLQAICRTNRTYTGPNGERKTHGLIVDYLGVFDDVAKALDFDEDAVAQVITNLDSLKDGLAEAVAACLAPFEAAGVDRSVAGYEGLIAAQQAIATPEAKDAFAADFSSLAKRWEALSPDPCLASSEIDYRWLTQVHESVKPAGGTGKLLWHALGPATLDLIHRHVELDSIGDDLETLVMDAAILEGFAAKEGGEAKAKEIELKLAARLRKNAGDPRFVALGERLEALREKQAQGLVTSLDFLKTLLSIARDTVHAEKDAAVKPEPNRGKAVLTELFAEVRTANTPIIVERIVEDIDAIVRPVRFDGWQGTSAGEREVQKALRTAMRRHQLHHDQDLFERAYGYIREHY